MTRHAALLLFLFLILMSFAPASSEEFIVYTAHQGFDSRIYLLNMDGSVSTYWEYANFRLVDLEVVNNQVYVAEAFAPRADRLDLITGDLEVIIDDWSLFYFYDLAFDGSHFYVTEWDLNRYDLDGTKLGTASFDEDVLGSAWDGSFLWTLDDAGQVKCWDVSAWPTITQIPGNNFASPSAQCRGLFFDGEFFWTAESVDGALGYIYKFDHDGAVVAQWLEPAFNGWAAVVIRIDEPIFTDGFESGGTGNWSSVVGEPPPNLIIFLDQPFSDTPAGTCSPPEDLVLQNGGTGTLNIDSISLQGRFFFQPGQGQIEGPISVPPYGFAETLHVTFCPDIDNNQTYLGQLVVSSNDPGSPHSVALSGTELTVVEILTAPFGHGETWTFPATAQGFCSDPDVLTIYNSGLADLTLESVVSSNSDFHIVNTPIPNSVLGPSQSYGLEVEFCPSVVGPISGTLFIDHNALNQPDPITIAFSGNGI